MSKLLASIALILTANLCDTAVAQPAPPPPPVHQGHACFWKREIYSFAAHDDNAVYMRVNVRDVYELKLFSNCLDLSWVHHLGLVTYGDSDICEGSNPGVDVVVNEVGLGHQRCPVTNIRKLTPDEVAALPRDARP